MSLQVCKHFHTTNPPNATRSLSLKLRDISLFKETARIDGEEMGLLQPQIMFAHVCALSFNSQQMRSAEDLRWFMSVALPSFQNLVKANLRQVPESARIMSRMIRGLTQLDSLNLRVWGGNILALQTLTRLQCLEVSIIHFGRMPMFSLASLTSLRSLTLSGFAAYGTDWSSIACLSSLRCLYLSNFVAYDPD